MNDWWSISGRDIWQERSPQTSKPRQDSSDRISADYQSEFPFTGGQIFKVIYDVGNDADVDAERELAAVMAWD